MKANVFFSIIKLALAATLLIYHFSPPADDPWTVIGQNTTWFAVVMYNVFAVCGLITAASEPAKFDKQVNGTPRWRRACSYVLTITLIATGWWWSATLHLLYSLRIAYHVEKAEEAKQ